jgi:predicted RNA-binding protein with PUA-like domain
MSNCDICIGGVDEYYEDYERADSTSGVDIQCEECREVIPAGTQYEAASGYYGSDRHEHKTCSSCVEIRDVFSCGEAVSHGDLWEQMREHAFPDLTTGSECFRELTTSNRVRVILKWQQWKGLQR